MNRESEMLEKDLNDKTEKDISIVIPLFDEEANIEKLYGQLKTVLQDLNKEYELIFIDDGSTDNSFSILQDFHEKDKTVKVVQFRRNFGKSAALSVGFKYAKGKIIVTMDADLQDDPREIANFIKKLDEGYDIVSGWRFERKDSFSKTLPSKLFNYLTSLLTGIKIHDFNCGFKVCKKEVIENINIYGELHRYIPVLAHWRGYKVGEIKVRHYPRGGGSSKYGIGRLFRGFTDLLTVLFLTRYARRPLHLFGAVGVLFFSIGVIINLYLLLLKLLGYGIGERPLLFLGVLLTVIGFQIISTGLIGEMIVAMRSKSDEDYVIKTILEQEEN